MPVNARYSLYFSDISQSSYPTFDCLYAYLIDAGKEVGSRYIRTYHLIPYCRRPDNEKDEEYQQQKTHTVGKSIAQIITFEELRKQGVTSEQLLAWDTPIDIAERYEMNESILDVFYQCSSPWFGSMCQYKFDYDTPVSFGEIVEATVKEYSSAENNVTTGTCYRFLNSCTRELWPLCLDWREICDGRPDCITGEDEQWCDQLERTECSEDEYRCHFGSQCIPRAFVKDNRMSIDCLDGSDEMEHAIMYNPLINFHCAAVSTFRCQELIARYPLAFQCGDGGYIRTNYVPSRMQLCTNKRDIELSRALLTSLEHIQDVHCRQAFYCSFHSNPQMIDIEIPSPVDSGPIIPLVDDVWDEDCEPLNQHCATEWVVIPEFPTMYGSFQLVFLTNRSVDAFKNSVAPDFICVDAQKCPALSFTAVSVDVIKGLTCYHTSDLIEFVEYFTFDQLLTAYPLLAKSCWLAGTDTECADPSYFYCNQSAKCIPKHRVADGAFDCKFFEDETSDTCHWNDSSRFICASSAHQCLAPVATGNGNSDCLFGEDEAYVYAKTTMKLIPYPLLCDSYGDYRGFSENETENDETHCEWWTCENPYTRCDKLWHCTNGVDELNCPYNQCSSDEHLCYNSFSNISHCLPLAHIFDKYINNCSDPLTVREIYRYHGRENISHDYFSWNSSRCVLSGTICRDSVDQRQIDVCLRESSQSQWMDQRIVRLLQDEEDVCYLNYDKDFSSQLRAFLKVTRIGYFPPKTPNFSVQLIVPHEQPKRIIPKIDIASVSYCHRGIAVLSAVNSTKVCLCPPNYFGARCQWQSQRISLTLQFIHRSTASIAVIFQIVIMLIDGEGRIAPNHEQITYMPSRDCDTKFNIYLLYPHRPKHTSENYSIWVDLFDKSTLDHWASWHLSIPFPFLPVNRIATQLSIPGVRDTRDCSLVCGHHGTCTPFLNAEGRFFCRCEQGYFGAQCEFHHHCKCAKDSFCLAPSICVCPLYKFGSHCYLNHHICQSFSNPCEHGGLCIPHDDRIGLTQYTCLCSEDYSGSRCENTNTRIDINLDDSILKSSSVVFMHFITALTDAEHQRTTILKKIPFNQNTITLHISQPFHVLFLQIPHQSYYLAILRETFIPSENIHTEIHSCQRCLSIVELLNSTFLMYDYLRRTKYYPLLCRENLQVKCFHDDDLMCLCDLDRFANCFLFNHTMNYDCQGKNNCENGGQCFQNNETCPTKSTCVCPDCYYGVRCQFSTKGFLFSLDPILGYHIKPNVLLFQQPWIIKISIVISSILIVSGLINALLSTLVFGRKKVRQVGSGIYLLFSSISSLCMIIVFIIKFWHLLFAQMLLINNRFLLSLSCISLDFMLKVLLASSEWLNACVAIERMVSVIRGFRFDRRKSQEFAKWVIPSVFVLTVLTHLHDPVHRQLIKDSDGDEQRTWCFVQYSSSVQVYNSFITLFHFLAPFSINFLTALCIVKNIARRRSIIQPGQPYQDHLQRQIYRHHHIFVAPCMLILLSLPRLVISFTQGCMRSPRQPWLYLIGYFVSFIPPMLTFVLFVLPSESYKTEFSIMYRQTILKLRRSI